MASVKIGSKADGFWREGQAWFCTSGFSSDVIVEVGDMSFHLHQFPLMSRSGVMERLIREASGEGEECCIIQLPQLPGSAKTFELVAKFCYSVKLELTAANVVYLRCTAELLEMTDDFGEGNLIVQTENFLNQVVLKSWNDSILALQTCHDVLPLADDLHIVKRCIDSVAAKACMDPSLYSGSLTERGSMQSPVGSIRWNAGARPSKHISEWWYEDVSCLSLPIYRRLISAMEYRGIGEETIAGSLASYAKKFLPGLKRFRVTGELSNLIPTSSTAAISEQDQILILEEICGLLPMQKGLMPTKLLLGLLRTAMILQASPSCISSLERIIGMQLDEASLEDLLMPNYSHSMETLYNIDSVQRILEHFLSLVEQVTGGLSPYSADEQQLSESPSLQPLTAVARLIDKFLAEIAPDINLKPSKFQALVASVPDYARPLDDGLYHAIDTYLKAHTWIEDLEREQLCRYIDCRKLSIQACTHAAQNERLPMRVIVQVLFFEQLQLKSSVASCFLVSDNLDMPRPCRRQSMEGEGHALMVGMDKMLARVNELERECSSMKHAIEKIGKAKSRRSFLSGGFGWKKTQMCSVQEGAVVDRRRLSSKAEKFKNKVKDDGSLHLEN